MRFVNMLAESGGIATRPYLREPYLLVQETIAAVASSIQANLRVSTSNLSAQLGVGRRSLQWIIHDDLNLFPYKVQITSWLNPLLLSIRLEINEMAEKDKNLINCLSEIIHETELYPERVTVSAVSSSCIIDPYWSSNENFKTNYYQLKSYHSVNS